MPINVLRFRHEGAISWGIVEKSVLLPLKTRAFTTAELLSEITAASAASMTANEPIDLDRVEVLAPITTNQQFICQGANYRQHMVESGMDPDEKRYNMLFTKASSCIVSAYADVVRPAHVRFLDYEIELGVVIGKAIHRKMHIRREDLHEYVAGVVIVNDVSARDVQLPQLQFYKGKSYRTFGPVGPHLTLLSKNEMPLLNELQLELRVNDQVRQKDSTLNMVHPIEETLTELSGLQDLHPGDLIATGTPAGCALSIPSPAKQRIGALLPERKKWEIFAKVQARRTQYLQPGDVMTSSIVSADGGVNLGTQRSLIVQG